MSEKRFFSILADDEYTLIQEKGNLRATYLKYSEVVDLLNKIQSLENEHERQNNEIKLLRKKIIELREDLEKIPPKIREVWLND